MSITAGSALSSEFANDPADPKIELHVHLEGAIRPDTLFALARKNKFELPVNSLEELERFYEFTDFHHFIDVWNVTTDVVTDADDFRRIVVEYAREAAGFGAVYLEAIVSPGQYYVRGISGDALYSGFTEGVAQALDETGVVVRLTPDIDRNRPLELSRQIIDDAIPFLDRGIIGIGLGGRERANPTVHFQELFQHARDNGFAAVPHAGEDDGAKSVQESIELLGAHRIRHGFRAIEDPDLLQEIIERDIVLDVCPTSNLRTRVVDDWKEHPYARLLEAGVRMTVNTDDPAMFGTDLGREHELAYSVGASPEQLFTAGIHGHAGGPEIDAWLRTLHTARWGSTSTPADEYSIGASR
ncbi:adenosine deaminase [Humidisolicoccus flavus]|uniref:adenosine deaminase n=1 Tax=Humidisolicoccus flavus TaxID=3111414 RepID=UPI003255086F